jgi:preprotein translocase subunit SecG
MNDSAKAGTIVSTPLCRGSIAPLRTSAARATSTRRTAKRQRTRARGPCTEQEPLIASHILNRASDHGAARREPLCTPTLLWYIRAVMGSMNMSMSHSGGHSTAVGGMSMNIGAHGSTNILPEWLAVLWTLAFIAIVVIHARHVLDSEGQRRIWHSGHVLMALGMAFMFAPASIDHFNIPSGFWQLAFANGAIAVLAWMLAQALSGRAINVLWLVMATDLGAMAYMWSPSGFQAPITWLLVAYFAAQSLLWVTNRMREVDHRTLPGGGVTVTADGAVTISSAEPLVCFRDLRASMFAMTLGMAYMFAAMQLMM